MVLKLPIDFAKKIGEVLVLQMQGVDQLFTFEEDRAGYFVAKLKPQQRLDKPQFKTMCALTRDLGGRDYVIGSGKWLAPGPFAKKSFEASQGQAASPPTAYKAPGSAVPTTAQKEYTFLPLTALLSMQFQSRTVQEGPEFDELVESVKTLGVLQPILVRPKGGLYEIVYGERRTAAAKKAGLQEIPARIKDLSDEEAYEIQLIENIQRKDLSDMEKARFLDMMIKQFGYTQEVLAKKVGKSKSWVSHHLSMLTAEEVVPGQLLESGSITEKQVRELSAATPEQREKILDKAKEEGKLPSANEMGRIRKSVSCSRCGDETSVPVNLGSSKEPVWCCSECAEAVAAEAKTGHEASITPGSGEEGGKVEAEEGEKSEKVEKKTSKAEQLKAVQIGEFECTECHKHFFVHHLPNGKHKLEAIRQEES